MRYKRRLFRVLEVSQTRKTPEVLITTSFIGHLWSSFPVFSHSEWGKAGGGRRTDERGYQHDLGGNLAGADTKTHDISGPQLLPPENKGAGGGAGPKHAGPWTCVDERHHVAQRALRRKGPMSASKSRGCAQSYTSTFVTFLLPFEDIFGSRKKDSGSRRNQRGRMRNSKISS
jgi:hypothetical protein